MLLLLAAAGPDLSEEVARQVARQECSAPQQGSEVVVCVRRGERSRYRVPDPPERFDPDGAKASVARERSGWIEEGDAGTGSCSAVGPGGWTGCMIKEWRRQRQQRGWYG